MLLYLLSALCLNKLMARGVDGAPPLAILGLNCPLPHMTDLRLWASFRGTQWGPTRVSPALWRDQGVTHV